MGIMTGLKAFVAAVLGGIGNIPGAVFGGLLIGSAETFVVGYGELGRHRSGWPYSYDLPRRRRLRDPDPGPALPPGGHPRLDASGKSLKAVPGDERPSDKLRTVFDSSLVRWHRVVTDSYMPSLR